MKRHSTQGSAPRLHTRKEIETLAARILDMVAAPEAEVMVSGRAGATTRFALGDAHVTTESEAAEVSLNVSIGGKRSEVKTNRLDETGLKALVADARAAAQNHRSPGRLHVLGPQIYPKGPRILFDASMAAMEAAAQADVFRAATDATEAAGLVGAGDLVVWTSAFGTLNTAGVALYQRSTYGQFSLTARTKDGTGSGWAWGGYEDWARVNVREIIARAVDLGLRSKNPVAVEPGRYTVILEPAAVAALLQPLLEPNRFEARMVDAGGTVFSKDPVGTNKLGLQMMDQRLGMVSSPWDPERPASTIGGGGSPVRGAVHWFEHGVLTNLAYDPEYARERGRQPVIASSGLRLEATGPTATLDEMIASTKRGIWVNRLSHVTEMNSRTLLLSGTTRDGTFLIENGKITRAIKNFRFTESPFFVFNKLEAAGEPVRASYSIVAPRLKVRDFDFTSLTDAI